jgi:hypothetical protein
MYDAVAGCFELGEQPGGDTFPAVVRLDLNDEDRAVSIDSPPATSGRLMRQHESSASSS